MMTEIRTGVMFSAVLSILILQGDEHRKSAPQTGRSDPAFHANDLLSRAAGFTANRIPETDGALLGIAIHFTIL
jgi:hypothetical protein